MLMLIYMDQEFAKSGKKAEEAPIGWTLEGRAFVIRNKENLVKDWMPLFFRHGKFQSFTRKLYRWGFRQVNLPKDTSSQEKRDLVFASPHFQRDKRELMVHMKSVTAASVRREQREQAYGESKLPDNQAAMVGQGLLSLGPVNLDALSVHQSGQAFVHPSLINLAALHGVGGIGDSAARPQHVNTVLDPVTRQLLLNQERNERGPSLMDIYRLQLPQLPQQVRIPSALSFNLGSADSVALPHSLLRQPQVAAPSPLESLLAAATAAPGPVPEASRREDVLQGRFLEIVQQMLRDSNAARPPA